MITVIHHNDNDGRCAAAIVKKRHDTIEKDEPIQFIEVCYKDPVPESIYAADKLIIVDFSYKPEDMRKIEAEVLHDNIIWIDHHVTAKEYGYDYNGLRDFDEPGLSGAELTWKYFFPDEPMPRVVKLVGDYDTWRHRDMDEISALAVLAFKEGMQLVGADIENWLPMLEGDAELLNTIVRNGHTCIRYRDKLCADWRKSFGYETEIGGLSCYALNIYKLGSQAYGDLINKYDAVIAYIHDGERFTVSLYSDNPNVDVSVVCKAQGGGGHKNAAGFVCTELPFNKKEKKA